MPTDRPRLPKDTYTSLLNYKANNHMAILAGEVAYVGRRSMWNLYRGLIIFLFGCALTIVSGVAFLAWVSR